MDVARTDRDTVFYDLAYSRRWTAYMCDWGDGQPPHVTALTTQWPHQGVADVLLLHGDHAAVAYRTPTTRDILHPEYVCWHHVETDQHPALYARNAVLTIPAPWEPEATYRFYTAPEMCRLPDRAKIVVIIRPEALITG